ncbi:MAG TPA: trehalose-phosphatase [Jatrophihabitantaceae bacterium]|nr:trehalose-phosphatase [Jatrophihabitantaceae bacterium]
MLPAELVAAFRPHLDGALIALDFDGTLAPIVRDPATSRPAEGAIEALRELASLGARIAVITGRDARTVLELGGLDAIPGMTVAGVYGAETWTSGELSSLPTPASIKQLRERLPDTVAPAVAQGAWIEDKRLSLVVHARMADDPDSALAAVREPVAALAGELGLEVHDGREVLEVRLPGYDKGAALRRLAGEPFASAVLFGGDDVGDLPAFSVLRELRAEGRPAWSVAAHSAEVPEISAAADVSVDGPEGIVALLADLARSD